MTRLILTSIALGLTFLMQAQSDIVTDRPDQTEASSVVPHKSIQFEAGLLWERTELPDLDVDHYALPNLLIRYGATSWLEGRLVVQQDAEKTGPEESSEFTTGFSDLEVGFKVQILRKEEVNTEIAFLSHASLPTGSEAFGNDNSTSISKLSISHVLSEKVGVGYNVGFNYYEASEYEFFYSLALGADLGGNFGFYIEPYGFFQELDDMSHYLDGGFTFTPEPNIQLDLSASRGLNEEYYYVNVGLSWLFENNSEEE